MPIDFTTINFDYKKLRKIREGRNITQSQVARDLGLKRQHIWNYEEGESDPSAETLLRLLLYYKVPPEQFTNASKKFLDNLYSRA